MSPRRLSAEGVVDELRARVVPGRPTALAFDGDGTLWTSDVGEIVFVYAVLNGMIREPAIEALREEAASVGLSREGSAAKLANSLFDAYRAGCYGERRVCEMMVWCYAGLDETEVRELTRVALDAASFTSTLNPLVLPLLDWARSEQIRTVVISASPQLVVEEAAAELGFAAADIAAGQPRVDGTTIRSEMLVAVPYAEAKVEAGRRLLGEADWLATFGDSDFDFDMMIAARVAVGVRAKPGLLARLSTHPCPLLLV